MIREREEKQSYFHVASYRLGLISFSLEGLLVFSMLALEDSLCSDREFSMTFPSVTPLAPSSLLPADNWKGERRPRLPPQGDGLRTERVWLPGALLSSRLSPRLLPHGCCVL